MSDRVRRPLAITVVAFVSVAVAVEGVVLLVHARADTTVPVYEYWLESTVSGPVFLGLTVLLLLRRRDQPLSWWFAAVSVAGATQGMAGSLAHWLAATGRPGPVPALSLAATFGQMTFVLALVALILLFPTGRLPGPRWRPVAVVFAAGAVALLVTSLRTEAALSVGPDVASPLAGSVPAVVSLVGGVGLAVGLVGTLVAVATRFRRAHGIERQQLRWFLASVVAGIACILLIPFGSLGWALGPSLVPTGIGVAILRYRLYDLDRVVSRTVTYAVVTAVLAGTYAALVVGMQAVTGPDDASDLVVAVSTLVAAALFRPVRDRVQRVVDRRFDRARFDHDRILHHFAGGLRDEVDRDAVELDLRDTVRDALAPAAVSLWLPGRSP